MPGNNSILPTLDSSIRHLFKSFVPILNPTGDESRLILALEKWLTARGISFTSDNTWGIFFEAHDKSSDTATASTVPLPILLMAHLDSEPRYLTQEALNSIKFDFYSDQFVWNGGPVGQDCKLGVVMCLAIVKQVISPKSPSLYLPIVSLSPKVASITCQWIQIESGRVPGASVRVLFTVGEEVGQRGLLRMPLEILAQVTRGIRLAIALDRTTEFGAAVDVGGLPVLQGTERISAI